MARLIAWLTESVPAGAAKARREVAAQILPLLPQRLRTAINPAYDWSRSDLKVVAKPERNKKTLLIGPANFGAQGYYWARAAETDPDVSAVNLRFSDKDQSALGPANTTVKRKVGRASHLWARRQEQAIAENVGYVLIESAQNLLGGNFGGDLSKEVEGLQTKGVKVAMVSHGSDVRLPSLHRSLEPNSPFHSDLGGLTAELEERAQKNHAALDHLGLPEFVSTPDLLAFRPNATWLPVTTDPERWTNIPPTRLDSKKLKVVHVPGGAPALKGADAINAAMARLQAEELIDYEELTHIRHVVSSADSPDQCPRLLGLRKK